MEQQQIEIHSLQLDSNEQNIHVDMLRLDLIHPQISGNKWFKLKYNLEVAHLQHAQQIISFGGAFSNHLHALAFAGNLVGIKTTGIVRGEAVMNPTLQDCKHWGMELKFISREGYRKKTETEFINQLQKSYPNSYIIPEGGDNELGIKGCAEILNSIHNQYDYIICPVGTATTFIGIINTTDAHCIGISALKNGHYLNQIIATKTEKRNWEMLHDYHFGGFAKTNQELFAYKNQFYNNYKIELDLVYTAKMMFGMEQLLHQKHFPNQSRILTIHTGGIQGNRGMK